jgi:hypothetical protein
MAQAPQRPFQRPQQQRPQAQQRHPQAQQERDPLSEPEPQSQQRFRDPLRGDESQGAIYEPETQPEPPVRTIADEQRERSAEMEAMGMDAWIAAHDQRSADEQPQQIPGVSPTQIEDDDRRSRSR